jgi:signal transduction histidine kinase
MMIAPGSEHRSPPITEESFGNLERWREDGRLQEEVLNSLVRLTQRIATARTYEEIFTVGADELNRFYDFDRCSLAFHDRVSRTMRIDHVRGRYVTYSSDRTMQSDIGMVGGYVVEHAEPLLYQLGPEDRFVLDDERRDQGIKELVSFPLIVDGEAIASMTISSTNSDIFHAEDLWIVKTIVDHLSVAVASTNLRRQAEARARRAQFLAEVSEMIASVQDVDSILLDVMKFAEPLLGDLQLIYRGDQVEGEILFQAISCSTERLRAIAEPIFRARATRERGGFIGPAAQGETIFIPDLRSAPIADSARENSERIGALSVIGLPLRAGGELLGSYVTARTIDRVLAGAYEPFNEDDLRLAQHFADRLASSFLSQRFHDETRQTLAVSEALRQIGQELSSSVDLEQIFQLVTNFARLLLNADYAAVAAEEPDGSFAWRAIVGNQTDAHLSARFVYGVGMVGKIAETRETLVIEGFPDNPDFPAESLPVHAAERMRSSIGIPLLSMDRVFGSLIVGYRHPHRVTTSDIRLGEALATQAAVALHAARLYASARAAIENRDQFLSVAAHELQTPLTSLRGRAQELDRRVSSSLPPQDADALRIMLRQADRLNRTVHDLMSISRLGPAHLALTREMVDLVALTRQLIEEANDGLETMQVHFTTLLESLIASVDSSRYEQVLTNLLSNARRFSEPNSHADVRLAAESQEAVIEVSDKGIGIHEADLERIFEPFVQVNPDTGAGVGLGLAICRQIVAHHGGRIWASSPGRGHGSTMTFTLPLQA